jgi:nitroreductase
MLIELLRKRRSIRQFEEKPVEQSKLDVIIEAMLRSPSSRGLDPWEFVVVNEKDTLVKLASAKTHGATFIRNAPLAIVVFADPGKSDVWVEDCSIATLLIHLAATDLGLGSCWVQIRNRNHDGEKSSEQYVKECLNLPSGAAVEAIVAIGYPKEEKAGHERGALLDSRVHYNRLP